MAKAKAMITENGGNFNDHSFSVKGVTGTWKIENQELKVEITGMPWYASESAVKEKLDDFFA